MFRLASIRWRLVASFVALALLTVCSVGAIALVLIRRNLNQREIQYLNANAQAVSRQASALMEPQPNVFALRQLASTASFLGNAQVRILDPQGHPLADSRTAGVDERILWMAPSQDLSAALADDNIQFGIISDGDRIMVVPITSAANRVLLERYLANNRATVIQRRNAPYGQRLGFGQPPTESPDDARRGSILRVSVPIGDAKQPVGSVELVSAFNISSAAVDTAERAIAIAGLAALALAIGLGLVLSRGLTQPLQSLAAAANQMGQGNLRVRAPVSNRPGPQDEFAQLAHQFNDMAARLDASFNALSAERDALRNFVADASHELRTPITALRAYNELLQTSARADTEAQTEFLSNSQQQIERLEWITRNLLDLSRLDAGIAKLDVREHDAAALLKTAAAPFALVAARKGIVLNVTLPNLPIPIHADRTRLEMALSNLIDNALKFTQSGGRVDVDVQATSATPAGARFSVRDTGPGISPTDLARVFDRFYRSPTVQANGSGLGLALVKAIAEAHHGTARATSTIGLGSEFIIELPA